MGEDKPQIGPFVGCIACLLLLGWVLVGVGGRDDAYISYWQAYALVETGGLYNINGEMVEQSSSLLHVILLALLTPILSVGMPTLGWCVSILAACGALHGVWRLGTQLKLSAPWMPSALLVVCFPFVYAAFSGLETALAAWVLVMVVSLAIRGLRDGFGRGVGVKFGLATLAAVMVRPEGGLVLLFAWVGLLVGAVARPSIARKGPEYAIRLGRMAAGTLMMSCALAVARFAVTGRLFPQPVSAKIGGVGPAQWSEGLTYLYHQALFPSLVVMTLVEGIGWFIRRKDLEPGEGGLGVVVWTGLGQFAFAVGSGGDWMEGARFLVPAMPLLAVAGVWALDGLEVRRRYGALAVLVVLGGVDTVVFSLTRSMGRPVWVRQTMTPPESVPWVEQSNQVYARDRWMANQVNRAVAALRDANDERVVVLTYQMGLIPFYVGKTHAPNLEFLDRSGLVTGHAHRCAAAQQLPRTRFGLDMSYSALFEVNSGLIEQCGWPRPELVVDLAVDPVSGEPAQAIAMTAVLEANGYDIVVVQEGQFPNGLTGRPVRHYQILGVDSALRHLLPPEWEVYSPQGE